MSDPKPTVDRTAPQERSVLVGISPYTLLWILVFVVAAFLRFHHLGEKPFHHDESLYSKYIWNFYVGQGYQYDPMQHGPFMFYISQVALFLFGISDTTVRLWPALFGVGLVMMPYFARRSLGSWAALAAGALLAVSPFFTYFSRFMREDAFYTFWSGALVLSLFEWLVQRRKFFAYASVFSMGMIFCIKENAFITTLTLATFPILFAVYSVVQKSRGRSAEHGGLSVAEILGRYPFLSKWFFFLAVWGVVLVAFAIWHVVFTYPSDRMAARASGAYRVYWGISILVGLGLLALTILARSRERRRSKAGQIGRVAFFPSGFFQDSWLFAGAALLTAGTFVVLYSTVFTHFKGLWDGLYYWFVYWWNQHYIKRIAGPFHYYNHLMWMYAALPMAVTIYFLGVRMFRRLSFVVATGIWVLIYLFGRDMKIGLLSDPMFTPAHFLFAVGVAIAGIWATIDYLIDREYVLAFLVYWFMTSYEVYSYLQEKVPWLTMHILLPVYLMAGIYLARGFARPIRGAFQWLGLAAVVLLAAFTIHTTFQVTWYNESDPTEQMVYVQTTTDITRLVDEIHEIAWWMNQDRQEDYMKIVVSGSATWPLYWYFRDWPVLYMGQVPRGEKVPVVICDWEQRTKFQTDLADDYRVRRYRLRAWWIPGRDSLDKDFSKKLKQIFDYLVYRKRWKPEMYGSSDICVFVRNDLAARSWELDLGELPVEAARPELPPAPLDSTVALRPETTLGTSGNRRGQLNLPKGVALDAAGNVYVADSENSRIQKFSPEGEVLLEFGEPGDGAGQFNKPIGIALDKSGEILVADTWNHRIQRFSPEGKFIENWGGQGSFYAPKGLVVDDEGFTYVVDTGFHRVHKFGQHGTEILVFGIKGSAADELAEPVGITIGSDGNLYIGDTGNKRIQVFTRLGKHVREIPVYGLEEYYSEPFVAVAPDGRILMTDSRNNRIQVLDRNGQFLQFWGGEAGSRPGQFNQPIGIAVAGSRVAVSDSLNHRIQIFSLPQP